MSCTTVRKSSIKFAHTFDPYRRPAALGLRISRLPGPLSSRQFGNFYRIVYSNLLEDSVPCDYSTTEGDYCATERTETVKSDANGASI